MENVPGLAQLRVQERIVKDLVLDGKYRVSVQEVNACNFGVPQTRKRLLFVGLSSSLGACPVVLRGSRASEHLLLARTENGSLGYEPTPSGLDGRQFLGRLLDTGDASIVTTRQAISDLAVLRPGRRADDLPDEDLPAPESSYQRIMRSARAVSNVSVPRINEDTILRLSAIPHGGNYLDLPHGLRDRYLTGQRWGPHNGSGRLGRRHYYAYRRLHPDFWAWTLNTKADSTYHWHAERALSVREFARIQSFPDNFKFTTDSRRGSIPGRIEGGPPILGTAKLGTQFHRCWLWRSPGSSRLCSHQILRRRNLGLGCDGRHRPSGGHAGVRRGQSRTAASRVSVGHRAGFPRDCLEARLPPLALDRQYNRPGALLRERQDTAGTAMVRTVFAVPRLGGRMPRVCTERSAIRDRLALQACLTGSRCRCVSGTARAGQEPESADARDAGPGRGPELESLVLNALAPWLQEPPPSDAMRELTDRIHQYTRLENKRKNLVGEGFEDVLAVLIRLLPASTVRLVRARCPLHEIPGFYEPRGREKPRIVDLAIVRDREDRRSLITAKWSIRADREEQFVSDCASYVHLERAGQSFDYVLITNEFESRSIGCGGRTPARGQSTIHQCGPRQYRRAEDRLWGRPTPLVRSGARPCTERAH